MEIKAEHRKTASRRRDAVFLCSFPYISLLVQRCLQSFGQLVRAGRFPESAGSAFEFFDDFMRIHALDEGADSLAIAVAAALELYIVDFSVYNIKSNET